MQTPRWAGILSRTAAAVLGGYGLASLVAACCALGLGPPRSEAVLTGMLLSYAVHACAAMYAFAACSAWRAWGGIAHGRQLPPLSPPQRVGADRIFARCPQRGPVARTGNGSVITHQGYARLFRGGGFAGAGRNMHNRRGRTRPD